MSYFKSQEMKRLDDLGEDISDWAFRLGRPLSEHEIKAVIELGDPNPVDDSKFEESEFA